MPLMAPPVSFDSQIYLETSHTARSNARTGIQTVVRGLVAGLSAHRCGARPVRWSFKQEGLTPLKQEWEVNLGIPSQGRAHLPLSSVLRPRHWPLFARTLGMDYKAPLHLHPWHAERLGGGWLILPELIEGRHMRLVAGYAKTHGLRVAGIFHDAIAWLHPELVLHWTREQHADYMMALAELDAVIAVSRQSARDFSEFHESRGGGAPQVFVCGLAAEIAGEAREAHVKDAGGEPVKILCVSTLEPRKNHAMLIEAFEAACSRLDGTKAELHFVGATYASAPEIARAVRAASARNPAVFWHENAGPGELRKNYRECDFTVFGSRIEGFGLPVLESLWLGRPCLCSDHGAMAENAAGGGCLTVDMRDGEALAAGMVKLAGDQDFRRALGAQAVQRNLKTWAEYAGEILKILRAI